MVVTDVFVLTLCISRYRLEKQANLDDELRYMIIVECIFEIELT